MAIEGEKSHVAMVFAVKGGAWRREERSRSGRGAVRSHGDRRSGGARRRGSAQGKAKDTRRGKRKKRAV
ncbi:hypothetical protein AMTR_s00096p00080960 [Amborella trichopoda]|uniref:Uncharacterized protein n=1 Tax=Amborella trichopoda TaxID=13333 RepID=W1P455_AMBTC|nr:hypothetical protein AMTR_s00096p00080960 [Amborella trichopoda]